MPRGCSICARPDVEQINDDYFRGIGFKALHDKYHASVGALHRHSQHLKVQLVPLQGETSTDALEPTAAALRTLYQRANELYEESKKEGDRLNAVRALKETRDILELTMKVTGELNNHPQIVHNHLHVSPEWTQLRAVMLRALQPYPEARIALVEALEGAEMTLEDGNA